MKALDDGRNGLNCFEEITIENMNNLVGAGYTQKWREKFLLSTIKGYMRIPAASTKGVDVTSGMLLLWKIAGTEISYPNVLPLMQSEVPNQELC